MDFCYSHEVLFRPEFPFIFLSAFYRLVCTFVQPTNICSGLNSHRLWGCSSDLNKNPSPYRSYFVMVETNPEQIKEGGDGFMRTNKAEVASFVMEERYYSFREGWSGMVLKRITEFEESPSGGGRQTM